MAIVVTLNPELEALLSDKASGQGQDVCLVVSELLARVLEWEEPDSQDDPILVNQLRSIK